MEKKTQKQNPPDNPWKVPGLSCSCVLLLSSFSAPEVWRRSSQASSTKVMLLKICLKIRDEVRPKIRRRRTCLSIA